MAKHIVADILQMVFVASKRDDVWFCVDAKNALRAPLTWGEVQPYLAAVTRR